MGNLLAELEVQLKSKNSEVSQNAKACKAIAEKLKELNDGVIWEREWSVLVQWDFRGNYPNEKWRKPTKIGEIFVKGLKM